MNHRIDQLAARRRRSFERRLADEIDALMELRTRIADGDRARLERDDLVRAIVEADPHTNRTLLAEFAGISRQQIHRILAT